MTTRFVNAAFVLCTLVSTAIATFPTLASQDVISSLTGAQAPPPCDCCGIRPNNCTPAPNQFCLTRYYVCKTCKKMGGLCGQGAATCPLPKCTGVPANNEKCNGKAKKQGLCV